MSKRTPIPTWFFALVVVRDNEGRFLVIQEKKHGQQWYLPARRIEPGEKLVDGAVRETLEESGVEVEIDGIVRFEHSPFPEATRVRVIFHARPIGGNADPTDDSLDARFVSLEQLKSLPLRSIEVERIFNHVDQCDSLAPLSILGYEGARFDSNRSPVQGTAPKNDG